ncbi:hypothetical protein Hanom_Chr13g01209201 [Helianthus anomalus]
MDAHEWNESLDRIISTIAEMIDLLKKESRRWASSPIFSTPLPSRAAASPPPTSDPVTTLPPPVSATTPTTSATQKQAARIALLPPKSAPFTVTKPTTPPTSYPREDTFMRDLKISYKVSATTPSKTTTMILATKKMKFTSFNSANRRRKWSPPWRPVETTPNATGRIQWRPPWQTVFVLEDKNALKRWGMICAMFDSIFTSHFLMMQLLHVFPLIPIFMVIMS